MDDTRIVAWDRELRAAHVKLRAALAVARESIDASADGQAGAATARPVELALYCIGFCTALDAHHRSEDGALFPELRSERPELAPVIEKLMQDHAMLAHLLSSFREAAERESEPADLHRHLDGIAAIMESHFAYEERQLLAPLAALRSDEPVSRLLGPL